MIVSFGLLPRYPGQSIEEFLKLWSAHAPWAKVVPKRLGYVQNFPVIREGRHLLPYPGFDVCAETVYDDEDSMEEAYTTPQSSDSFEDHRRFVSERGYCHVVAEKRDVRVDGRPPANAVKLLTFMRSHPSELREACVEAVTGPYAAAIAETKPIRHEQFIATKPLDRLKGEHGLSWLRANLTLSGFDVIDIIWFASPDDALRFVSSQAAYDAALTMAGTVLGTERLIARPRINTPPADIAQ